MKRRASVNRQSGVSLFELLASLSLSIITAGAGVAALGQMLRSADIVVTVHERLTAHARAQFLAQKVADSMDSNPLWLLPRIHPPGTISFTDGTPNPVMRSRRSPPASHASAISAAVLASQALLDMRLTERLPNGARFTACPRFSPVPKHIVENGLIGIFSDGYLHLRSTVHRRTGNMKCFELTAQLSRSSVVPPASAHLLPYVRLGIPIRELFTLYLDAEGTLRYLGHRDGRNIENQPIHEGHRDLQWEMTPVGESGAYMITANLTPWSNHGVSAFAANHLAKRGHYNLLLNR